MKKVDTSFHDFVVHDLLADILGIRSRRMFGGWGIYKRDKFFAIIMGGRLYLKARAELAAQFKKHRSKPFVYTRKPKKRVTLSYWSVPEDVLENRDEFFRWVEGSLAAKKSE